MNTKAPTESASHAVPLHSGQAAVTPGAEPSPPLALNEDSALALLQQPGLTSADLEQLARTSGLVKFRKVKVALLSHPRTPRHISLPLVRQLYTFDLMQIALTPVVAADLKRAADEALCNRLATISWGERLSLARRASGRVAGALLHDKESRVMRAALENARLTEAYVIQGITQASAPATFVEAVCHHPQWSLRREVRIALLRHEKTPMARAIEFARGLPANQLREILRNSRLPENIKAYLVRDLGRRQGTNADSSGHI
jgi:hypothetical protein